MRIQDVDNEVSIALPAAGASADSDSIDLGAVNVGPVAAGCQVEITTPALPSLADNKTLTLNLQHSGDDGVDDAYVPVPTTGNMILTGAGGVGVPANTFRFYLPPDTKRYIRLDAAVQGSGGDNTALNAQLALTI